MRSFTLSLAALVLVGLQLFGVAPAALANTNDFSYESWDTSVTLEVQANGRAVAHVVETLTARFPEHDQNKGLVRGLPLRYQGADSRPRNVSVTDENGDPLPYFTETDENFFVILTGNNDFVHGLNTYVISYDIPDPIFQPDDADVDELYWDMVSTSRLQPIERFSASVTLSAELASAFTGAATAYRGQYGSRDTVPITESEGVFSIEELPLDRNEAVSFAIGLERDSVTQPNSRADSFGFEVLPIIVAGSGFLLSILPQIFAGLLKKKRRTTGRPVIAQYDVPHYLPPLIAAAVARGTSPQPTSSEILHLAVNGHLRIEEQLRPNGSPYKTPRLTLQRLQGSPHELDPLDVEMMSALFTHPDTHRFDLPRASSSFVSSMTKVTQHAKKEASNRGYFTTERSPAARLTAWISLAVAVAALLLCTVSLSSGFTSPLVPIAFGLVLMSVFGIITGLRKHRVHTQLGASTAEYLAGVKLFITVAESERIAMLQSVSGAERYDAQGAQVVYLYEKLLPYAVLFGVEKEWSRVLATQYESVSVTSPHWYPMLGARGVAGLNTSITALNSSIVSASSYQSSSSSGSSGGGFSGGGGGGGFSGGR